ncbi:MAG: endonuclease III [Acidimicrobiales bacterium]
MPREGKAARAHRAGRIDEILARSYPGSARDLCALEHEGPFQLLVATILSAQCTDERVNMVTPVLFSRYPDAAALAAAREEDVEEIVKSTGFFRSKAKNLLGCARALVEREGEAFPTSMEDLTALPGVGRKTANVVRSVALGLPGLPVDTHVTRLSHRLRLSSSDGAVKIESDLCALLSPEKWGEISVRLILHGRRICVARKPRCDECELAELCPSAGLGSLVKAVGQRRRG